MSQALLSQVKKICQNCGSHRGIIQAKNFVACKGCLEHYCNKCRKFNSAIVDVSPPITYKVEGRHGDMIQVRPYVYRECRTCFKQAVS